MSRRILRREAVRRAGYGDPDLRHAGRRRQLRFRWKSGWASQSARSLVVPSHFDYQKQALLYVPQHLPDPRSPAFTGAAADEIIRILTHSQRPRVRAVHQLSADARWCTIACRSKSNIRRCCKAPARATRCSKSSARTPNCVLFATSSFWQGVDVQGDQLSCVIIDKLPFAVPSDPVVEARIAANPRRGRQSVLRLPDSRRPRWR